MEAQPDKQAYNRILNLHKNSAGADCQKTVQSAPSLFIILAGQYISLSLSLIA
jgi:hypothetical protein